MGCGVAITTPTPVPMAMDDMPNLLIRLHCMLPTFVYSQLKYINHLSHSLNLSSLRLDGFQLMRDPVTISTGISYDHDSIEKWLYSCKNKACERNRSCLEASGAVEFLVSIIKRDDSTSLQVENNKGSEFIKASDEALSIFYDIKVSKSCLRSIISNDEVFVAYLVQVLENGNHKSRAYATMILKDLFQVADPTQLINVKSELFAQLVRALSDDVSQQATKAALKLLVELCPWGRNRIKAVEGGAVFVLIELLLGTSETRASELALIVLGHLCGCAEGRAELLKHGAGLAIVSKKIFRVSHGASNMAVRIISSISKFSATSRVLQEMLEVGVVRKLILVVKVDSNSKRKERAREMLKLHSRVWRNPACIPCHLLSSYQS
ncbi:hypothetical protein Goklo_010412 [Gossypium klotzschianum]|uniref:U-box domain-containing protein n=1 Tax=Gossypium klotzschianum TaxID=34286 RepID=A0A7J8V607_9ROSI|nr:hypothetical protein [Gossypium klotzschianum]